MSKNSPKGLFLRLTFSDGSMVAYGMFITTHAAIGALIGQSLPNNPALAFTLGMASHFLTDLIPHGDTNLYKNYIAKTKAYRSVAYVVVDSFVLLLFIAYFFSSDLIISRQAVTYGIIGGVLPDFIVGFYEVFKPRWLKWFHRIHFLFHNHFSGHKDIPFSVGFALQLIFLMGILSVII